MEELVKLIGTDEAMWPLIVFQFVVVELKALWNKKDGDTWSEVTRYVFGFSKRAANGDIKEMQGWGMRLRRLSFYGIMAWYTIHISG